MDEMSEVNDFFTPPGKRRNRLPEWLDHFNQADLKTLFKCCVAAWVMTLLILINPALRVIGQATFFGVVVIIIAPPSGVVFMGLAAGLTVLVGMCLAWAWGVISMKAALSTRPAADLQRQYQTLQESIPPNSPSTFLQVAIFEGYMLDTRVTITYFCMIGLFVYLIARLRVAAPKLTLVSLFGIIISDTFLTVGPLLPTFNGTLARTLVIPASIGVALSLICNVLLFPKSTSHLVLDDMEKMLPPMHKFIEACSIHFATPSMTMDLARLKQTKANLVQTYGGLDLKLKFLALDVSFCRWSAGDIKSLRDPVRQLLLSFLSLLHIQIGVQEFRLKDDELLQLAEQIHGALEKHEVSGEYQLMRTLDLRRNFRDERDKSIIEDSLKDFAVSSRNLLQTAQQALECVGEGIRECNRKRWSMKLAQADCEKRRHTYDGVLRELQLHKDKFVAEVASSLWSRYAQHSQSTGPNAGLSSKSTHSLAGLVRVLVLEERLIHFADSVQSLLGRVRTLEHERIKTKLWMPGSLKDVIPWVLATDAGSDELDPQLNRIQTVTERGEGSTTKQSPIDNEPPALSVELTSSNVVKPRGGRRRSGVARLTIAVVGWLSSTEGVYALRMLILTMALGAIAANKHTAGFFYREKGIWGLIMGQFALAPYTADFLFGLILRLCGTVLGAIIGLAAWYIGAGDGPGNPYGMAAILAPAIVVAMWLRLFTKPVFLQAIMITTATVYLVVAYSWVDTHMPRFGNPGVGYEVFWRRMLLVIIGFTAATLVTLLPRPPSANRHYRELLLNALGTVKDQYALFVGCKASVHSPSTIKEIAEKMAVGLGEILVPAESGVKLTRLEFSTSTIDSNTLGLVCHLCMNLNQYITQLIMYVNSLPADAKERFFGDTGAAEEQNVANVMAVLTIAQHGLKNGKPLPTVLPVPLMEKALARMENRLREMGTNLGKMDHSVLEKRETRRYLSALSAFTQFLGSMDELVLVVKRAVGETSYIDPVAY
ncbi:uncharacterized protein PV06_07899 [Exophiala oligosperma]|uniref:ER transporter 6TM N-terminal domain-containing protein n=1 Tax=Exophiala oligosperma TaxID=215243 RepID=A0A0D2BTD9_9EURO|nr:uncharacterized protein PV06_07899 [Exophiala oligosperma]KIW40722.1 hypothetical protein PV06_07899 [Exophiala oligosperma]